MLDTQHITIHKHIRRTFEPDFHERKQWRTTIMVTNVNMTAMHNKEILRGKASTKKVSKLNLVF
eukprot:m.286753 g.286753  ORF g.286753 m.286753 type:complete len:64 (-) comp16353_c2_seq6:1953-2144(-)